ncbi:hypothetical protein TcG_06642 [Trypanosoma cruzi]|uniref:CTLH domain-containing protein n=1 Tax=Trypanosoma cruzi TaxID=5693 RepID=A0A2V2VBH6_TRYCR|nr:hypothetical protein TcBrA4_0026600 [Trypanosoma cruzi]PBJ71699.1 hypothetical protein BCY84_16373 [Trypanosoma cruzi cruzi]PWU93584.1 hypothetical protein C4B63_30g289 [Trypanosoma cruzi]RNF16070.1 hypothetical protein TcG_06642 [Trypanosoma cruzi]
MDEPPADRFLSEEESKQRSEVGEAISIPSSTLVEFNPRSDTIRGELLHVVVGWLIEQGLTSSAQILRDEAAALLRQEHNERKALRAISRAIHEGNWDTAHAQLKKLESITKPDGSANSEVPLRIVSLLQLMPFLLAQQQFLEYVDEDDGQRAHVFFMRRIKPLEGTISKDHFQQLIYLLTCRNVSEAGGMFPIWRGWTPTIGRSQLQSLITKFIGYCDSSPYCRQYEGSFDAGPHIAFKGLEQILANSLSYELLKSQHPSLLRGLTTHSVHSILQPLGEQLVPSNLIASIDVNEVRCGNAAARGKNVRLTACEPFLQLHAVVVGTHMGSILWVPLEKKSVESLSGASCDACLKLYQYNTPVRGMTSHERQILLSWSACQAVVLNLGSIMGSASDLLGTSECWMDCVANTFTHTAEVYSSCFFPSGFILATGLSDGTVAVWDMLTGAKMFQRSFSTSAIESLTSNRSGSCYFAASKEGLVRVVDVTTGVLLFTFASPVASEISSIALSPSASLLLVSYRSGILRLWDVLTGDILPQRFEGVESHTRKGASVTFGCVDSHIICGHNDGYLYIWDIGTARSRESSILLSSTAPNGTAEPFQREMAGLHSSSIPGRYYWPMGEAVPPPVRTKLHRSSITDVKFQHHYVVTCSDDGIVCICSGLSSHSR